MSLATHLTRLIMAIQHKHLPYFGVQFHPESIKTGMPVTQYILKITEFGRQIIANFRDFTLRYKPHSSATSLPPQSPQSPQSPQPHPTCASQEKERKKQFEVTSQTVHTVSRRRMHFLTLLYTTINLNLGIRNRPNIWPLICFFTALFLVRLLKANSRD